MTIDEFVDNLNNYFRLKDRKENYTEYLLAIRSELKKHKYYDFHKLYEYIKNNYNYCPNVKNISEIINKKTEWDKKGILSSEGFYILNQKWLDKFGYTKEKEQKYHPHVNFFTPRLTEFVRQYVEENIVTDEARTSIVFSKLLAMQNNGK